MLKRVTFENVKSAALLKFDGFVSNKTLKTLFYMLMRRLIVVENTSEYLEKWRLVRGGGYKVHLDKAKRLELEEKQGNVMKHFMENIFDYREYLLTQIDPDENCWGIDEDMQQLIDEGFVECEKRLTWDRYNRTHTTLYCFKLTHKGEAYLSFAINPKIIEKYQKMVEDKGLDSSLLAEFICIKCCDKYDGFHYSHSYYITEFNVADYYKYYVKKMAIDGIIYNPEKAIEHFKNSPFSIESLLTTYNALFNSNNDGFYEVDNAISRLRLLTAEKLVQDGCDYESALIQANEIIDTIKTYKNQVITALNGESDYPEESLTEAIKKLKYPKISC